MRICACTTIKFKTKMVVMSLHRLLKNLVDGMEDSKNGRKVFIQGCTVMESHGQKDLLYSQGHLKIFCFIFFCVIVAER